MVNVLDSRLSSPFSSPDRGQCVIFLARHFILTVYKWVPEHLILGDKTVMD